VSDIRPLDDGDYDAFVTIAGNAYPAFKLATAEDRQRLADRLRAQNDDPIIHVYGLYRDSVLQAGMILFDFTMQLLSVRAPVGGVGMIAVDILHKKEKIAYDLVQYILRHYRARGATLATLYPFRPDFYRQMGFGMGTQMSQYRVRPADLPKGPSKRHITFLQADEQELLRDCYNRCLARTHGLMEKSNRELSGMFSNPELRVVAYKRDGRVEGYLAFSFKSGHAENFTIHDMFVRELYYETPEALSELLTFLHSQADQVRRVIFHTQDEDFYHALSDPRNGTDNMVPQVAHETSTQGIGIMYRVIDTPGLFRLLGEHNFGGQSCRLKLDIHDSFFPENEGSTIVHFRQGRPEVVEGGDYDLAVELDVADFSSLIMGSVRFRSLVQYGLATISDSSMVDAIDRLFRTERKPMCTTPF
jgi:predicted acetyltransferase